MRRTRIRTRTPWPWAGLLALLALTGCATNPVTGERELGLVSESEELSMGEKEYRPTRQAQGGDYTIDKQLTAYVSKIGQSLAKVSDRPLPYEFIVINNSVPNAWALPGGKLALNRGLLVALKNEAELAAVLSHEIVHAAARHGAKAMERAIMMQVGVLAVGIATQDSSSQGLAVVGTQVGALMVNQRYGRSAETEADRYGMIYMTRAGYDPKAAVTLQELFVKLSKDRDPNWLGGLFRSHPPSQDRVQANRDMLKTLPRGGKLGAEKYQKMIAHLKKTKPAYEKYAKAQKAAKEGDDIEAMSLIKQAISIEPKEGHFYSLRGDLYYRGKNFPRAEREYSKAIEQNDQFFYYYLQRGLSREKLGQQAGARLDLGQSIKLLPTRSAQTALRRLSQ